MNIWKLLREASLRHVFNVLWIKIIMWQIPLGLKKL